MRTIYNVGTHKISGDYGVIIMKHLHESCLDQFIQLGELPFSKGD